MILKIQQKILTMQVTVEIFIRELNLTLKCESESGKILQQRNSVVEFMDQNFLSVCGKIFILKFLNVRKTKTYSWFV